MIINTEDLQQRFAEMALAQINPIVYLVIGELKYGEGDEEENSHGMGTERYLVGACLDKVSAEKLIAEDHFESLVEAEFLPLHNPLQPTEEPDTYSVTISGRDGAKYFHNALTWRIVEFSANERITDFKL